MHYNIIIEFDGYVCLCAVQIEENKLMNITYVPCIASLDKLMQLLWIVALANDCKSKSLSGLFEDAISIWPIDAYRSREKCAQPQMKA